MTPAAIRAWLASLTMSNQAKAALAYVGALERVADQAWKYDHWTERDGWMDERLSDALAALDALKAGKP